MSRLLAWVRKLWGTEPRTRVLGRKGESAAADYLRAHGYRILARNVVVPMGEADLLAESPDGQSIVLVEVKTRERTGHANSDAVPPEAAITAHKRRKLRAIARHLIRANNWHDRAFRIDVVGVEVAIDGTTHVRHSIGVI